MHGRAAWDRSSVTGHCSAYGPKEGKDIHRIAVVLDIRLHPQLTVGRDDGMKGKLKVDIVLVSK